MLTVALPNDPTLKGIEFCVQGVADQAGVGSGFSNLWCDAVVK